MILSQVIGEPDPGHREGPARGPREALAPTLSLEPEPLYGHAGMGRTPLSNQGEAGENLTDIDFLQVSEKRFRIRLNNLRFIKKTPDKEKSVDKGNIREAGNVKAPVIRPKIHCYIPSL